MKQKVRESVDSNHNHHGYLIFCPACKQGHLFDKRWTFNNDFENPTFEPSMLVKYPSGEPTETEFVEVGGQKYKKMVICHSFVRNGKIEYLNDCTHEYAGQTKELIEF